MAQISSGLNQQQIALNNNAGAWTNISAQIVSRYAEAVEDFVGDGGTAQGLEYQLPIYTDGVITGWGPTIAVPPGQEPVQFGDKKYLYTGKGPILGQPGQQLIGNANLTAATVICRMRSATATATTINFTEFQ